MKLSFLFSCFDVQKSELTLHKAGIYRVDFSSVLMSGCISKLHAVSLTVENGEKLPPGDKA